jgi:hypothetical protein
VEAAIVNRAAGTARTEIPSCCRFTQVPPR